MDETNEEGLEGEKKKKEEAGNVDDEMKMEEG